MKTDITVVLDRSGSMASCKEEAEGGLNAFIQKQATEEGETLFSLVQFDHEYEWVHQGVIVQDVDPYVLEPRGMTALNDAVGTAINETGARLSAMPASERPDLVIFVIVTDGGENSSSEFTGDQVKQMVERQRDEYQWQFTYLGANQDAFAEASKIGILRGATANYVGENSHEVFVAASNNVGRMRGQSVGGQSVSCSYTDEERTAMVEESSS